MTNALLDLFVLFLFFMCVCLFACFCLFEHTFFCLFDSFAWLVIITFCLTIIAGMVRQYKSMQSMSHDWETVSRETVRHMT